MSKGYLALGAGLGVVLIAGGVGAFIDKGAAEPSLKTIQTAYDAEKTIGNPAHDLSLKITSATCNEVLQGSFSCLVSFVRTSETEQKPYFDVAVLAHQGAVWTLKSGICKH